MAKKLTAYEKFKEAGIEVDPNPRTTVVFLGPKALAALTKLAEPEGPEPEPEKG